MTKRLNSAVFRLLILVLLSSCINQGPNAVIDQKPGANNKLNTDKNSTGAIANLSVQSASTANNVFPGKETMKRRYVNINPSNWGGNVPEVLTRLKTKDKVIALTFDACGGKGGSAYDQKLINFLIREKIPAILFINARWIDANPDTFLTLAKKPPFRNRESWIRTSAIVGVRTIGLRHSWYKECR